MSQDKYQKILSALAEQEKEHGYFVLAASSSWQVERENFTVSLSIKKEHGYFVLATPFYEW